MLALIILVVVIGAVAVAIGVIRDRLYLRRVDKAIRLIQAENPEYDADAARSALERDRQRRFHSDDDPTSGPTALAA